MNIAAQSLTDSISHLPVWMQALIGIGTVLLGVGIYTINEERTDNCALTLLSIIVGFAGFVVLLDAL